MNYWLIKSEPSVYAFEQLQRDDSTVWDGIRNYQARNNLRTMAVGDQCLYYHSNEDRAVVGIATVSAIAFPDPTADSDQWLAVEVKPGAAFVHPVTLAAMKADAALAGMSLIRQSRLSVCPVTHEEFKHVCELGGAGHS